jgi:hypothetical protein
MYLEKEELGSEMAIGLGIGVAIILIGYFIYKKSSTTTVAVGAVLENSGEIEKALDSFMEDIRDDYSNEYRINYLGVRYNIPELASESTYVFKTKRVGSLSSILEYNQLETGEKYLNDFIRINYNTEVPVDDQLEFITEISRIEGKIRAVESVKSLIPAEDYSRLNDELEEDKLHYKRKYAVAAV